MKRKTFVVLLLFFLISFPAAAEEDRVVAKIGDENITASQLDRILKLYDIERKKQMRRNPRFKRQILEKYVEGIVLSKKAREKGLDALPEVKDRIEIMTNEILSKSYIQKEIVEKIVPSEEEIRRYYDIHKAEFTRPEQVSLRQIFIRIEPSAPADQKERMRGRAEEIRKKLEKGEDFAALAAQFSDDPEAKTKGGSLGFIRRGRLVPEIDKVAFSLRPGQISEVIELDRGFCVLKVDEAKDSVLRPFDDVREEVKARVLLDLKNKRMNEFRAKAMREAGVEFYLETPVPGKSKAKD